MSIGHTLDSGIHRSHSSCTPQAPAAGARAPRRQMTREAGQAIERLAHAIEYLCDEAVHESGTMFVGDPRLEAVQILMSLQRSVYCECPPFVSLWTRVRTSLLNSLKAPEMTSTAVK